MTFANPSYLWALTGLAIPLAIHLLSRKEGTVVRVGSIRHVEESNTSQFKSIRLNEILLLLLRMLMVAALALFMSGAQCTGVDTQKKIVYAEKGMNVDSLTSKGFELHEIPEGSHWSFAEKLNQSSFETVVISYSHVDDFKGERISLNDNIRWITAESPSTEFQVLAWSIGDSVFVRNAKSNSMLTSFSTKQSVPNSIEIVKPHVVNIKSDNKIVLAALNVLKKQYRLPISFSEGQLVVVVNSIGPLVERVSPTEIRMNKALDQDIALNDNLVIELFKVLYPELQKPEVNKDARVLPDEFTFSENKTAAIASTTSHTGIEKYFIGLFLLALAAERFVAIRKNQ